MDIKKVLEKQIDELMNYIEEKNSYLSIEEYIMLHRQLENYILAFIKI